MQFELTDRTIWQIGSGYAKKPYDDICLKFGIAMVGPGKHGDVRKPRKEEYDQKSAELDWGSVLLQVKVGDLVLLRRGRNKIIAVGEVVKEYDYSELLEDIHGWDMQHYIGVKWYIPANPLTFTGSPLAIAAISRVQGKRVINRIAGEKFAPYSMEQVDFATLQKI